MGSRISSLNINEIYNDEADEVELRESVVERHTKWNTRIWKSSSTTCPTSCPSQRQDVLSNQQLQPASAEDAGSDNELNLNDEHDDGNDTASLKHSEHGDRQEQGEDGVADEYEQDAPNDASGANAVDPAEPDATAATSKKNAPAEAAGGDANDEEEQKQQLVTKLNGLVNHVESRHEAIINELSELPELRPPRMRTRWTSCCPRTTPRGRRIHSCWSCARPSSTRSPKW